ncbi:MAG: hypothetical protein AAF702_19470 [Chloroflexota bacterium]
MNQAVDIFVHSLAILLGLDPKERVRVILLFAFGVITIGWFGDSLMALLTWGDWDWAFWLGLLGFPAVVWLTYRAIQYRWQQAAQRPADPLQATQQPDPAQGLILFLSTFRLIGAKVKGNDSLIWWDGSDLVKALDAEKPDWDLILNQVNASNMQLPLEAIFHHRKEGTLRYLWIITTRDMPDGANIDVNIGADVDTSLQGSYRVAQAFKQIVHHHISREIQIFTDPERLTISPYNAEDAYTAVEQIYREVGEWNNGITPDDLITDISGGTITMTSGMILASILQGRRVQYTATANDPEYGHLLERPKPYALTFDQTALRRNLLHQLVELYPANASNDNRPNENQSNAN